MFLKLISKSWQIFFPKGGMWHSNRLLLIKIPSYFDISHLNISFAFCNKDQLKTFFYPPKFANTLLFPETSLKSIWVDVSLFEE